jgi:hypothetical protein
MQTTDKDGGGEKAYANDVTRFFIHHGNMLLRYTGDQIDTLEQRR